ncbi:formyltransferase family protein [Halorussus amylolyticus]|uniref:formyltransferase family protein n=1 Tax=Halorussus amylolyticus TaxID=1126242 RepID=UPI0010535139|nr:formyltransferase family protein [Halorussus amylolyticus]
MCGASDSKLEIAVLVSDESIEKWQRNALATLVAEPDIDITHVVINNGNNVSDYRREWMAFARDALERIRAYPLWSLVGVARLLTPTPEYERHVRIDSIEGVSNAERLFCSPQSEGEFWNTFPGEIVDRIENVDVVVRFGFGMIKGRILEAPEYGVLSYHPGDIRAYRGQPGGFWEFLDGEDEMGVTVQRLNETLDGGEIAALEVIDIKEVNTWQEIKKKAFSTAEGMLPPAVRSLTDPEKAVEHPDEIGALYSTPTGWAVVRYVFKNTRGRIRNYISDRVPPLGHE